jgi:hypothetical protein
LLSGCGTRHSSNKNPDCVSIKAFVDLKQRMNALDVETTDLYPMPFTIKNMRATAPSYRDATAKYAALLREARTELATARLGGLPSGIIDLGLLTTQSLEARRDAMDFFAQTFAHPTPLARPKKLRQFFVRGRPLGLKIEKLNARFSAITAPEGLLLKYKTTCWWQESAAPGRARGAGRAIRRTSLFALHRATRPRGRLNLPSRSGERRAGMRRF